MHIHLPNFLSIIKITEHRMRLGGKSHGNGGKSLKIFFLSSSTVLKSM